MATGMNDKYANIASAKASMSGTDVVFVELQTGISLGQGMGIIIDQIDYTISTVELTRLADNEELVMGWTTSNTLPDLALTTKGVIDSSRVSRTDFGTAASAQLLVNPIERKFAPPIIVAAPRIYLGVKGVTSSVGSVVSRLMYRYIKLSDKEYLELAETFLLVG